MLLNTYFDFTSNFKIYYR
eukprot:UN09914